MIRLYARRDYDDLKAWSLEHGVGVFPPHVYRVGLVKVADETARRVAMIFMLLSNAGEGVCYLESFTTNPLNTPLESAHAEDELHEAALALAKEHNCGLVITRAPARRIARYQRKGWKANHPITPLIKIIDHGN